MLKPMLASLADAPLQDASLVYEPKYDGIRAIAEVPAGAAAARAVRLWSRLGNEKTAQFPEVAAALASWARRRKEPVILDGEIVALDVEGQPTGFQQLQGRIHLSDVIEATSASRHSRPSTASGSSRPTVAFVVFDVLRVGRTDLREHPLLERRAVLEDLFRDAVSPMLRISDQVRGDGRKLYRLALDRGWEGLIAKHADSRYKSGKRTPDWRKLKIVQEQEFVIGGWTEPRQSRVYFGALLLGVYEDDEPSNRGTREARKATGREHDSASSAHSAVKNLVYVGHTGTGFNARELARVMTLLKPLETDACPFIQRPRTNERPHWVQPKLVAQIKFTEWTADNKLRHPVYLGLRDDKKPEEVRRETRSRLTDGTTVRLKARLKADTTPAAVALLEQLRAIEDSRRDGTLELPDGGRLAVSNLHKVFWPRQTLTKGDLFRYYAEVAPFLLPAVADRPLVMKRFPNGITGKPFYQHRAQDVPPGVRVETVSVGETRPQLIGGTLTTLLYMTQLAAISQDPWFSRVQSPEFADYAAFDLDPSSGAPFDRVLEVARWIHDELEMLGAESVPKTSGADGLHIYIPLPARTPYDAGLLFCQIVATVVSQKHPREATIERSVRARGKRVYIDCLQNIPGKTLATAYSARASDYAGISTPLTWQEVHDGVRREQFTIRSIPSRLKEVGDLWARLRESKGVDLSRVSRYQK